ncbi:hypothetical protein HPB50_001179 [Hyalomma asiaticum]|uniref:Uncharacterized protein n=1 Tax=Hyalomma asiaticum TaxID=266040 RepID=A0ACB7RRQ3_HYAAI|nr:hypothetical protein HPB50_001179 [Hyalomma asiaticum]
MPGHDADGEELPAADALDTDGSSWRQVYARSRKPASSLKKTSVVDTSTEEPQKVLASIRRNAPRPPPLPADDYKIVLRIRGGFNCADTPLPKLIHAILQAAALTRSLQDQYRINAVSNTILVSTPDSERTDAYFQIKTIKMDNRSYEVASHITDPSNTCKGVIRNVPVDHTAETIMSSLLDYDRLGLILTGRRMGATTSVLVTFRGTRVPYYINYQGGVIRCVPYRYRTEACNLCRTVGHRPDVCPSAPQSLCQVCGVPNPPHDHDCQPKCVVCQKDHPTGSPQCPQRYKPKPKPAPLLFEKDAASLLGPSTLSQNNQRGRSPSPTKRQERRSRSRSRSRRRNRSRSKSVYPDNGRRTGPGNQPLATGDMSREEKEQIIQLRMEEMRRKNEELLRRHAEIEADKKNADLLSSAAIKDNSLRKPPPAESSSLPQEKAEKKPLKPKQPREPRVRPVPPPVERDSVTHRMQRLSMEDGPPPDPNYRFLADRMREGDADGCGDTGGDRGGSRRHRDNYGGQDFDNVRHAMRQDKALRRESNSVLPPNLAMTGRQRREYEQWKSDRAAIDQERMQRHTDAEGNFTREWDLHKGQQMGRSKGNEHPEQQTGAAGTCALSLPNGTIVLLREQSKYRARVMSGVITENCSRLPSVPKKCSSSTNETQLPTPARPLEGAATRESSLSAIRSAPARPMKAL